MSSRAHGKVTSAQTARLNALLNRPENRSCFDCDTRQPRWASTNLGVFFCLRCAGIHRSMGVHISKVKSTNMDVWEESMISFIEHVGNERGRVLYECSMPDSARPRSSTDARTTERMLRDKYERRTYYNKNFDAVLAAFLETPLESLVPSPTGQSSPTLTKPTRAEPTAQPPVAAVPMEELWGGPAEHKPLPLPPPPSERTHTLVSDLFSTPVSPSNPHVSGAWISNSGSPNNVSSPVWGPPPPPVGVHTSHHDHIATHSHGGVTSMYAAVTTPDVYRRPPPPPPPELPRAHSDDLFSSGAVNRQGSDARSEVLALFSSAPVTGGGGGTVHAPVNAAWQPKVSRPYYYP